MTDENRRADTARENDDSDLVPKTRTPSASGGTGGDLAREIGAEDEEKRAIEGEDAGLTRVDKREERERATDRQPDMR